MPIISRASAPIFSHGPTGQTSFVGLAAPSRGAVETSVWEVTLGPGTPALEHSLDREEVLVALAGRATATIDGEAHEVASGDAIVVPAHRRFSLANPHDAPFVAVAVLPVGARATIAGGAPFTPPWAE
jgi:quercetin dioxygenase-like cupin family protein